MGGGISGAERMRLERLERLTREYANPGRAYCPLCGNSVIDQSSSVETYYGVCRKCLTDARTRAIAQQQGELDAKRRYDAARKRLERTKKSMGIPCTNERFEPIF